MASAYLSTKLVGSIDRGIDFASQLRLSIRQRGNNLSKLDVAHHEQIGIACCVLLAAGHRAIEQGKLDSIAQ